MAMEINGNLSDFSVKEQYYNSYAPQSMAGNSKPNSTAEYVRELAKLAPSVEFKVGNSFQTAKTGQTLTINPKLLEKMRNDPEKEKEMKELIRGVESMTKLVDGINNASGWKTVFRHSYIDENGKYCHIALVRNESGYKMSEKLREERRKNAEKLIEKTKEKVAKKKEELEDMKEAKAEEKSACDKVKRILDEKIAASEDGMIYLNDTDFKTIIDAIQEDSADKTSIKEKKEVGANLDLKI